MKPANHINLYELPEWEHPAYYGGFSPDGDFLIYSRHRDSSILDNSNYDRILETLQKHAETLPEPPEFDEQITGRGEEDFTQWVYDFRARHWAVGWCETILIRYDAPDSLQRLAAEIIGALSDYPVFDEQHYSEQEHEAIAEYWENLSTQDRIDECDRAGVSIFNARRDSLSEADDRLYDWIRDTIDQ